MRDILIVTGWTAAVLWISYIGDKIYFDNSILTLDLRSLG